MRYCFLPQYLNNQTMSQQQKIPVPPPMPVRYPFFPPPPFMDKMNNPPGNINSNSMPNLGPNLPPNINPMQAPPFMPSRMYSPFYNGYNMLGMPQMGPFPPFMPMVRNPQMPSVPPDNSKNAKEKQDKISMLKANLSRQPPPFFNQPMFIPPPPQFLNQTQLSNKQTPLSNKQTLKKADNDVSVKQPINVQISNKKQVRVAQSSSSQTPVGREQEKTIVRHSAQNFSQPEGPRKKRKKSNSEMEANNHRQTRQKKESIERVMQKVMKNKPQRQRVIRIGREYQAYIPESFSNEYEYNLKIKLMKKSDLLNRLVPLGTF